MNSYRLMFTGVRSSLVFLGFGLKPPASDFQSYSYSSLKTSPCTPLELGDKSSKISWALKLSDAIISSESKKFTCLQKALAFLYKFGMTGNVGKS